MEGLDALQTKVEVSWTSLLQRCSEVSTIVRFVSSCGTVLFSSVRWNYASCLRCTWRCNGTVKHDVKMGTNIDEKHGYFCSNTNVRWRSVKVLCCKWQTPWMYQENWMQCWMQSPVHFYESCLVALEAKMVQLLHTKLPRWPRDDCTTAALCGS